VAKRSRQADGPDPRQDFCDRACAERSDDSAAGSEDPFRCLGRPDKVVQTLRAGCAHMRRAFDIESINVDELISTALNDQKAVGTGIKAFHLEKAIARSGVRMVAAKVAGAEGTG
jgi:hypothetical protein